MFLTLSALIVEVATSTTTSAPADSNTLIYLLGFLATGGLLTALVSYLRLRKQGAAEKEEIITRAAEQAVSALQVSLTKLEDDLQRARIEREDIQTKLDSTQEKRYDLSNKVAELTDRIRDIEEQIIGYRSKESFVKTVLSTYDGILLVRLSTGEIEYANPAAYILFGYAPNELVNKQLTVLFPDSLSQLIEELQLQMLRDPIMGYLNDQIPSLIGKKKHGETYPVRVKVSPLENELAIITISDVH